MSASRDADRIGGFWARGLASIVDGTLTYLVSFAALLVVLGVVYWARRLGGNEVGFGKAFSAAFIQIVFAIISTPLWFAYYIVGHAKYGTTVGKWLLKLKVVSAPDGGALSMGQSTLRAFGYMVSYLVFGAGFLMALFNKERMALHDQIANTRVIRLDKRQRIRAAVLVLAAIAPAAGGSPVAWASKPIPQLGIHALALDESRTIGQVYGTRLELATKWQPFEGRGMTVGPRIGADMLFGDSPARGHALTVGGESALWIMNAIGMGLAVEYAVALQNRAAASSWWVAEPFLRVRTERLGLGGAFVLHASPVYESAFGFGWRVGAVVEFSGVFGI